MADDSDTPFGGFGKKWLIRADQPANDSAPSPELPAGETFAEQAPPSTESPPEYIPEPPLTDPFATPEAKAEAEKELESIVFAMPKPAPRRAARAGAGREGFRALREESRQDLCAPPGRAQRLDRVGARRGGRAARPQRRGEDHLLLHDHRSRAAGLRQYLSRRHRHHPAADVSPRPARHRLPAAGGERVPRPLGRAEHHGRCSKLPSRIPRSATRCATS